MVQMASTNTILQTIVEEHLRGRVMAFYTMAFLGTRADRQPARRRRRGRIGAQMDDCALRRVRASPAGLWFALRLPTLRALVRPIYIERGILPVPAVDSGAKTL